MTMKPLSPFEAHWPAISALLDEALGLPAPERTSWLEGLTGERAAHREALRALLGHQAQVETDDFLNALPQMNTATSAPPLGRLAAGSSVGAYRLIAETGEGGMGTVWLAERADGLMNRRVALKLPHMVWGDSFAERLAREREILATLEHEHIARLYDAGIDAHGRPFLAMEYVDGEPIDAYCRTHALAVRERIALLLQVMAAVSHAHSRLVVHRDLKPSNILVTREAKVKLLDFGIAKLLEGDSTRRTALTELWGRALTLDYASPEQIRGDPLSTASDVYSLGVVMFELLTGARPYRLRRGSAAELEDAIAHADAPRASSVATESDAIKALRGDLDAILDKALRKQIADRYQNVESLTDDLTRYLDNVPVRARPQRRWYLARRYAARHRTAVVAATVIVLALGVGLGVSLWQADAARRSERIAMQALDRERAVQDLLIETLAVAVTADPAKVREPDGFGMLLQAKFDEFERRFQDRPEQWLGLLELVSNKLPAYGDYACSLAVGQRYLALLKKTHPVDPVRLMRAYAANAHAFLGLHYRSEAAALLVSAVAVQTNDPAAASLREQLNAELRRLSVANEQSGGAPPGPAQGGSPRSR